MNDLYFKTILFKSYLNIKDSDLSGTNLHDLFLKQAKYKLEKGS